MRRNSIEILGILAIMASIGSYGCADDQGEIVAESDQEISQKIGVSVQAGVVIADQDGQAIEAAPQAHRVSRGVDVDTRDELVRHRVGRVASQAERASPTERFVASLADHDPDNMVRVTVQLDDVGFDFAQIRSAQADQRAARVEERKQAIDARQRDLIGVLQQRGGKDFKQLWLVNQVSATLPAGQVAGLVDLAGVTAVLPDSEKGGSLLAYSGIEGRDGMNINAFLDHGYDGNNNGRAGGAVRIGVIEWNNFMARTHKGFQDWAGGPNRVKQVHDCRGLSCLLTATDQNNSHGTHVSWVAAGSIEQGQDSVFPGGGTADQERRSGIATEAEVYYYTIDGCSELSAALQEAVSDGVDVVNMSFWVWSRNCMAHYDDNCGGVNGAITNAVNAGVLVVAAAGNESRATGDCTMVYPSWRSDVLAVGALDTTHSTTAYGTAVQTGYSSEGGVPLKTVGGVSSTYSGVDLSAPGLWSYNFTNAPASYNTTWRISGTSFASPAVAGSGALLRDEFNTRGWGVNNARVLFINLLTMGDTWDHNTGADRSSGVSDVSGYGRFNLHRPSGTDLAGPWGWGWRYFTIHDGETHKFTVWDAAAESPLVTQTKWAVTWFESNPNSVADIVIKLVNTCPPGGGQVTVGLDYSFDLRKSVSLDQSQIGGRCLEMQVIGIDVPPGGRTVYSADYFHSGAHD
ncbi:MAG: S8 family serine peptidase [Proteobacteria bacterium]|nr:S8 family serine peptidase [Pseudomonadota bacterium]